MQFGYVDQGLSETADLQKQFNINTYAPTMLVFKENVDKPADIIQVNCSLIVSFPQENLLYLCSLCHFVLCRLKG